MTMNPERAEIIKIIDQAILIHEANVAKLELKKAELGEAAPNSLVNGILHAQGEIERLQHRRNRVTGNGGRVTQRERDQMINAQLGVIRGDVLAMKADLATQGNGLDEVRALTGEIRVLADTIRDECPLFRADMEEGPLIYVKPRPQGDV